MSILNTTETIQKPSQSIIDEISSMGDYILRVFNNDTTTFMEVIYVLMTAMPCDMAYAQTCAVHIDAFGSSEVMKSTQVHCEEVQKALNLIKVKSEVIPALD